MKKIVYILIAVGLFSACDKNEIVPPMQPADGAQFTVLHMAPGVPPIDVLLNGTNITGTYTLTQTDGGIGGKSFLTGIANSSRFPNQGYALMSTGQNGIKVVTSTPVPLTVTPPTIAYGTNLIDLNQNWESGKYYSVYMVGTPTLGVSSFVIEDNLPEKAVGKAFLRFVNTVTEKAIDFYATYTPAGATTATTVKIAENIAYKGYSDFITIDVAATGTSYVIQPRLAGTTTNVGSPTSSTNITQGRCYTYIARGTGTATGTTGGATTLMINR